MSRRRCIKRNSAVRALCYFQNMSAVEKIKQAAATLNPDEQFELFRWWTESGVFRQRQLAALKRDIATGIEDLDNGRFQTYSEANIMQLAEDIGQSGRSEERRVGKECRSRW